MKVSINVTRDRKNREKLFSTGVWLIAVQVIGHFWAEAQIICLWHEGFMTWVQCQLDLDVVYGYIHGPCTTTCIWANTAWNLLKVLYGIFYHKLSIIRWFKFTLKPPYTIMSGHLLLAIWDTSYWTSFVKFGLNTAWDISYDILWLILKYVNFWLLQGHSSTLGKILCLQKINFFSMKEWQGFEEAGGFRWAGP